MNDDLSNAQIAILCAIYRVHGKKRKGVKHVPVDRIKQLIPHKYHKDFKNELKELQNLNLVQRIKSKTYALTKQGFALAYTYFKEGTCELVRSEK